MNFSGLIRSTCIAALLAGSAPAVLAAAAVAASDGSYTYAATNFDSLDEAKAAALEGCGQMTSGCTILVSTTDAEAIAVAKGKGGLSAAIRATPEAARKEALAQCQKSYKDCKFTALYWEGGTKWAAWGKAKDEQGTLKASYFAYGYDSEADARQAAIEGCTKQQGDAKPYACETLVQSGDWTYAQADSNSYSSIFLRERQADAASAALAECKARSKPGDTCKLTQFVNPGKRKAPASFAKLAKLTEVEREKARPAQRQVATRAVQNLTCTNDCVNGSCVRTFPNGRTEKWQAPRVFDPFTNDWKWETNSCGG